jgi:hypothetical protein
VTSQTSAARPAGGSSSSYPNPIIVTRVPISTICSRTRSSGRATRVISTTNAISPKISLTKPNAVSAGSSP